MSKHLRARLETLLKAPIVTPNDGRRVAEAAQLLTTLLEIESRVGELEAGHEAGGQVVVARERAPAYGDDIQGMSLHEAAQRVLADAGHPMHVRDLAVRLRAHGWRPKRNPNSTPERVAYQIAARLPRHPETFVRVRPNTFALVGMDPHSPVPRPVLPMFSASNAPPGSDFRYMPDVD